MSPPVYATQSDLGALSALPAAVLSAIPGGTLDAALASASRTADSYLAARYTLPLTAWQVDLTQAVCDVAAYRLISREGYRPDGPDEDFRERYEDAVAWLEAVSRGVVTPDIVDTAPQPGYLGSVSTKCPRGW